MMNTKKLAMHTKIEKKKQYELNASHDCDFNKNKT